VILSEDKTKVLLAKRENEQDYDGVNTFIGCKMETTDETILAGMKREKDEEIGQAARIKVLPHESYNLLYRKKDGNAMILPHIAGIYTGGKVKLNDEYGDYKRVAISELETF
jgi:hypothetical protein